MKSPYRCNGKHAIKIACLAIFGFVSLHGASAWALDYQGSVFGGASWTDNAQNNNDDLFDKKTNSERSIGVTLEALHRASRFDAAMDYSATYEMNSFNEFAEETSLDGSAQLRFYIDPESLSFAISHLSEQTLRDSQQEDIASNRDQRDETRVGPTLSLQLSDRDVLRADAAYAEVRFRESERSNTNNEIYSVRWIRQLSSVAVLTTGLGFEKISNEDGGGETEETSTSISFLRRTSFGEIELSVINIKDEVTQGEGVDAELVPGLTVEDFRQDSSSSSNGYGIALTVNRFGQWVLDYSKARGDSAALGSGTLGATLVNQSGETIEVTGEINSDTRSIVDIETVLMVWELPLKQRYSSTLTVELDNTDFVTSSRADEELYELRWAFQVRNNRRLTSSLEFAHEIFKVDDEEQREDDTSSLELGVTYRLNPDASLNANIGYETQDSNVEVNKYDSWSSELRLTYDF